MIPFYSAFGVSQVGLAVHDTTMVVGDIINIPVYVDSSLTGENVSSYNLQLRFNDYYLEIDSVLFSGTLSEGWGAPVFNVNSNKINIASAGATTLSGKGILLFLRAKAIRSGGSHVEFTDTSNNYFNEGTPRVKLDNGYIGIAPKPSINVSPNTALLTVGETKQFNVYSGTAPYAWSVNNPSIATVDTNGLLTALSKGFCKVIAEDANGIKDTTDKIEIRAFKLSVKDTSFYKGLEVDIPIYASDLTGLNFISGSFTLSFNENILTPELIMTNGTLLESYTAPQFSFNNGNMNIAFAGTSPLAGSGKLLVIRFNITNENSGGTWLEFNDIIFNESELGNSARGYFSVLNPAALRLTPGTATLLAGDTLRFSTNDGIPPYTWSVSNPSVASIDNTGLLTALKGGVVQVHAMDAFGGSGTSGDILIYDTRVWAPDTSVTPGTILEYPIYMEDISSSYSIVALQTEVDFDSSVIKFEEVITSGTNTNGWSFSVNNQGDKIIIAGAGSNGFNYKGTIFKLKFNVSPYAINNSSTNLFFNDFTFNEGSPNALTEKGKITISTTIPNAPNNLSAVSIAYNSVTLNWSDNSNNETGFIIEKKLGSGSWNAVDTTAENTTSFSVTGLTDGSAYYFRVAAVNSLGMSPYSNEISTVTLLPPPGNLSGSFIAEYYLNLTWTDSSSSESGFIIERMDGNPAANSFYSLDTVGANISSYIDSSFGSESIYSYRVKAFNTLIESEYSNTIQIELVSMEETGEIPSDYSLYQNYPNPFNPTTIIKYSIPSLVKGRSSFVHLRVYDALGKEVATLVSEEKSPGNYQIEFNGSGLSSGIYLYRITTGKFIEVKKMILVK